MKLGVARRIDKNDLARAGDVPKWVDALIDPLNALIENVVTALSGRLTFQDNFLCKVSTYAISSGTELEINPFQSASSNLRVSGVVPLGTSAGQIESFGWSQKTNGNIGITASIAGAGEVTIKVLILLE